MTVKSAERKIIYIGNGTTSEFEVPFFFLKDTDIEVFLFDGSLQKRLEKDVDYSIVGAGEEKRGLITTKSPVANGCEIAIVREIPYVQEMDIPENDIFPSQNMERALDRLTMQTQQLKELADRAVTVDIFSDANPSEIVGKIEALYDVKEQVVTASENIGAIVVAANDIEAIKDAPAQATAAIESAESALASALASEKHAQTALISASGAKESADIAVVSAKTATDAAKQAVSKNIGDIFYTSRLDNELNGAVEANGDVYAVADFTGAQSVPVLLADGKLPYVSMEEYESIVSANGSCRAWGYDGGDTFRVPTAEKMKRVLVAKKEATTEDPTWYNLYSDGWLEQGGYVSFSSGATQTINLLKPYANTDYTITESFVYESSVNYHESIKRLSETIDSFQLVAYDTLPSAYWQTSGYAEIPTEAEYQFQNIEVQRAMVQIATGATDEALATCTGVLVDVADLKQNKADKDVSVKDIPSTSETVTLADNTIYSGTMTDAMTFVLPTVTEATKYHQIKAMLYLPVVTIDWGTTHYMSGEAPDVSEAGQYMIYWDYVPALSAWAVGCMKVV